MIFLQKITGVKQNGFIQHSFFNKKRSAGFTLVEMIISIGLFALLLLLITSAFAYLINIQRTIDSKQQILNDFRLGIDIMVKEMTSGSAFPAGCEQGCESIIFTTKPRPDMPLRNIEYRFDATEKTLTKAEQRTYGTCAVIPFNANCYQPFVTDKITVDSALFFVNNKGQDSQPIITLQINGVIMQGTKYADDFGITTSVSPRFFQDPLATPPSDNVFPVVTITGPTSADEYTTADPTISLSGTATDNDNVSEVRWRNETTGESGIVGGSLSNWSTDAINLEAGVENNLVIEAIDPGGLIGIDTLTVNSTAALPPLHDPDFTATQYCNYGTEEWLYGGCSPGVDDVYFYRCDGECSWSSYEEIDWGSFNLIETVVNCGWAADYDVEVGSDYTYTARLHRQSTNEFSNYAPPDTDHIVEPWSCDSEIGEGYTCYGGVTCDGSNVEGTPGQVVCGTDFTEYQCREEGWISNGSACTCNDGSGGGEEETTFSLSANPTLVRVLVSGTVTTTRLSTLTTIQASPSNSTIVFALSGGPVGTIPFFNPPVGGQTSFRVSIPDSTPLGLYPLTIRGTNGSGEISDTTVYLDVAVQGGGQQ